MTELRAKARASGVYMRVVKNTLARKAMAGTSFESMGPQLKGPLVLAFSKDDPGAAARLIKDFAKTNDKGELVKQPFGPWMRSAFGLLAKLKGLLDETGTDWAVIDVAGFAARKAESERRGKRRGGSGHFGYGPLCGSRCGTCWRARCSATPRWR